MNPTSRSTLAGWSMALALSAAGPLHAAPNAAVEGVTDGALRVQIEQALGEARLAPTSRLDARRRANQAALDAVALLRSEGYYDGAATPKVTGGPPFRAVVEVTPGPRYRLAEPAIDWVGDPPDEVARAAALKALGLSKGAPGRAADILAAEGRLAAELQKKGYADATIQPREVVVDHEALTVAPTFCAAAGGRVVLGQVRVIGKGKTRPGWVAKLAPWKPGKTVYDPPLLAKLEKRLIETGVYESATVDLAQPPSGPAGPRPVEVTLVDRKGHTLELGAGYSTTEGSGADAKWTTYNVQGFGDSLVLTAKLYDIQQKLDLEDRRPDFFRADQALILGGGFLRERTPAYDDLGGGVRASLVRKYDRATSLTFGATFDYASTTEKSAINPLMEPVGETLDLFITSTRAAFVLDRSNSILDPTRGWRLEVEADPTWVAGGRNLVYLKTVAQLSAYLPVRGRDTVVAARVKLGSIAGGSVPGVPADRRFYAGGGGSVRGYGYQDVGPRLADNTPEGGVSLTEGSLEVRQSIGKGWGLVAFADVGGVGSSPTPQFDGLSVGVGAGVRYDLGFGPLRLDIGTPLNPRRGDSPVQIYISIGQAF